MLNSEVDLVKLGFESKITNIHSASLFICKGCVFWLLSCNCVCTMYLLYGKIQH